MGDSMIDGFALLAAMGYLALTLVVHFMAFVVAALIAVRRRRDEG